MGLPLVSHGKWLFLSGVSTLHPFFDSLHSFLTGRPVSCLWLGFRTSDGGQSFGDVQSFKGFLKGDHL